MWTLKDLVEQRVKDYQLESASYLNIVSEGMETSDEKVMKTISDLEDLRPALQEAQAVGDSILRSSMSRRPSTSEHTLCRW